MLPDARLHNALARTRTHAQSSLRATSYLLKERTRAHARTMPVEFLWLSGITTPPAGSCSAGQPRSILWMDVLLPVTPACKHARKLHTATSHGYQQEEKEAQSQPVDMALVICLTTSRLLVLMHQSPRNTVKITQTP